MPAFPLPISRAGNSNIAARCKANTVPRFAMTPRLSWGATIGLSLFKLLAASQTITLVVGGTATNGTYQLTFSGGGLAAPVVVTATRDAAETNDQMAAELEAAIQTARGTTLAGVVTNETVTTNTITITCLTKLTNVAPVSVAVSFPGAATGTLTYTYVSTIDASNATGPARMFHAFPTNVVRGLCAITRKVAVVGPTTCTVTVGDAGDTDGLLTSTDLKTTGVVQTTGAAERIPRQESAFQPYIVITTSGATPMPPQSITAGEFEVQIHYEPIPKVA